MITHNPKTPMLNLTYRPMTHVDLNLVVQIEQSSAKPPWRRFHFESSIASGHMCTLVECNEEPIGHSVMMIADSEASLLAFTVKKEYQHRGVGRQFLRFLIRTVQSRNCNIIFLEVRASNTIAFRLYSQEGFCEVGVRKNYYVMCKSYEDALVMAKEIL